MWKGWLLFGLSNLGLRAPEGEGGGGGGGAGAGAGGAGAGGAGAGGGGAGGGAVTPTGYHAIIGADGNLAANWADQLPEKVKVHGPSVAAFKTVDALIEGYGNLKTRLGKAATAAFVPGENPTPEEISAFRQANNAPKDAAGYKLDEPPQGVAKEKWNPEYGKAVAAILDAHHVPAAVADKLKALEATRIAQAGQAAEEEAKKWQAEINGKLSKVWGAEVEKHKERARQVAGQLGCDLNTADAADVALMLDRIATLCDEDSKLRTALGITLGSLVPLGDSPGARARDIMTNKDNPLYKKYHGGDEGTNKMVLDLLAQEDRNKSIRNAK